MHHIGIISSSRLGIGTNSGFESKQKKQGSKKQERVGDRDMEYMSKQEIIHTANARLPSTNRQLILKEMPGRPNLHESRKLLRKNAGKHTPWTYMTATSLEDYDRRPRYPSAQRMEYTHARIPAQTGSGSCTQSQANTADPRLAAHGHAGRNMTRIERNEMW